VLDERGDHPLQGRWNPGHRRQRRSPVPGSVPIEELVPRGHLVDDEPQREEIRSRVFRTAAPLLYALEALAYLRKR
jgi:hypothetical protein